MKGHDIAIMVGPPGKSKGKSYDDTESPEEDTGEDAEGGQEEAEVNAMADYQEALKGPPEEALKAFKALCDLVM